MTKAKSELGNEITCSVFDEKVQANQDRVYFQHLYLWPTTKK